MSIGMTEAGNDHGRVATIQSRSPRFLVLVFITVGKGAKKNPHGQPRARRRFTRAQKRVRGKPAECWLPAHKKSRPCGMFWYLHRESNPDQQFRKLLFYPLNYGDNSCVAAAKLSKIPGNAQRKGGKASAGFFPVHVRPAIMALAAFPACLGLTRPLAERRPGGKPPWPLT